MKSMIGTRVPWLVIVLLVFCAACNDDDDDDNDVREVCAEDDPLAIESSDRGQGLHLIEQAVALTGGCFDDNTTATLVFPGGAESDLAVAAQYPSTLTATVPGRLALGQYTIRVERDGLTDEIGYDAISNVIVSGAYEGKIYVVDMTDTAHPVEAASFEVWPGDWAAWTSHPSVSYDGMKAYFWGYEDEEQSAIYAVDLPSGGNVTKVSDDSVLHFHTPDASPVAGKVTFLGCADVANVCDIYTANDDGTDLQMVADHLDQVLINGDTTDSWGLWNPVFSPDGQKIAFLRETVCPGCTYDWYSVVMIMDADGGNPEVVAWEPQVRFYEFLRWTWDDYLVWKRSDNDLSPQQLVAMKVGGGGVFEIEAPSGSWDSGWEGGGDGFVWLAFSPLDDAMVFQPFNTSVMFYYPLTMGAAAGSAGTGWSLNIPDGADGFFAHYNEFDWFGWMP